VTCQFDYYIGTLETPCVLIADDDEAARAELRPAITDAFPGAALLEADDGEEAWAMLNSATPIATILDTSMPGANGIEIAQRMHAEPRLRAVPIVLLSSKLITLDDVRAIEDKPRVLIGNKGAFPAKAAAAEAARLASGESCLSAQTSALVKRAIAFMNERYARPLARWQIAEAVNMSEDYLTRTFRRELGLTPWGYLTRLRIEKAKALIASGPESTALVGAQVGFPDQAYFSRVFKKVSGMNPREYRDLQRSRGHSQSRGKTLRGEGSQNA
jgi:YesN/AraC family two-component response regulator